MGKLKMLISVLIFAICLLIAYSLLDGYESSVLSYSLAGDEPVNPLRALPDYFRYLYAEYRFECLLGFIAVIIAAWKRQFAGAALTLGFIAAYALLILKFYGVNYRLEHINLAVLFFTLFLFIRILPAIHPGIRYVLIFLVWMHVWSNGREVTRRIADQYRQHVTLQTSLIMESQCLGDNLIILDDPRLDSMGIIPLAYFQQSVLLSAANPALETRGILPAAALMENLVSLQLPVDEQTIDSLLSLDSPDAVTGYVNALTVDRFPLGPVFRITDFSFAWRTADELCH